MAPDTVLDTVPSALSKEKHVSITFHSTSNANGFVCQLDGATPGACISPFEADVADGPHTFEVSAALGKRVDDTPAVHAWKVDATAPDTTLVMGPPALDNTVDPKLAFTGADPGGGDVTFECKLDTGTFGTCNSPEPVNVTNGAHAFEVRAVDLAGNVDPTPASHAWTVDTSTPDTAIVLGPSLGSTTLPNATFTFSSPATGVTFECSLDAGAFVACTSPQVYPALADGAHTFTVRAKNAAGNPDPTPATRMWTVDGTAPTVAITAKPTNPSNDSTPSFTFSALDATATFACAIDAGAFAACTSVFTSAALADGSHTFHVRPTDPVGNVGAEASYTWVIDTMAPTAAITAGPAGLIAVATASYTFTTTGSPTATECQLDGAAFAACTSPKAYTAIADGMHTFVVRVTDAAGNAGMDLRTFTVDTTAPTVMITTAPTNPTNDNTPTFAFVTAGAPAVVDCSLDGGGFAACTNPTTTAALADGSHTFVVRATDAAGNRGSDLRTFTIDTAPPVVAIVTKPTNPAASATANFTFTVSEGAPQCKLDGAAFAACASPRSYTGLADGSHMFTVRAADALGNIGSATYTWTVDTTPPTVTITSMPTNPSSSAAASFSFTVSEGAPQCKFDGAAFTACTSPQAYTGLARGAHTFTVQSTDAVGNVGSATSTWTVDTTPPVVTITAKPTNPSNTAAASFAFTVSEGSPQCKLDDAAFVACTSPTAYASLASGSHTFTVQSADAVGNLGSASYTWTVDITPPTVTITAKPTNPSNVATASFAFTVSDGVVQCSLDGAPFATCASPQAYTGLAVGSHSFVVRSTDAAGNVGMDTWVWTVDTVAPVVAITAKPANPVASTTASFSFTATEGSPQCSLDGAAFTACTSPKVYTGLSQTSHVFVVRSTDAAGNTGSATWTWVVDTTAPIVTITAKPSNPTNLATGTFVFGTSEGALECQLDGSAFASCSSPKSYSGLGEGSHTFNVRAADAAGNVGAATWSWTVDTIVPVVTLVNKPSNPSANRNPQITFTVSEGAPMCKLDLAGFAPCASPLSYANLTDGSHMLTVQSTDAANNTGSASYTWSIDATGPVVTFASTPPQKWPVNYFDFSWSANETATYECSLNGAAFTTCGSTLSVIASYNTNNTFSVRGADTLGNVGAARSYSWTPTDGLVLHYPWEQGVLRNTSLLAQTPAYSPDSPAQLPAVGGWGGTALRSPRANTYAGTTRPLRSSASKTYTGGMWIRIFSDADRGVLWSTSNGTWGHEVSISGLTVTLRVWENGTIYTTTGRVTYGTWSHVGVRTTGPGKGLELYVNGSFAGIAQPPSATGFDDNQADLRVGRADSLDIDDLRFYNTLIDPCTMVRGVVSSAGACTPNQPALELDFEGGGIAESGTMNLGVSAPLWSPQPGRLGDAFKLGSPQVPLSLNSFAQQAPLPGHSISLWVSGASPPDVLFSFAMQCPAASAVGNSGISIDWTDSKQFSIFTGTGLQFQRTTVAPGTSLDATRMHNLVLAEQRNANGNSVSLRVYVDGTAVTQINIPSGNLFGAVNDTVSLARAAGTVLDGVELWPQDISTNTEMLCENGFDGEYNPATDTCSLTAN